MPSTNAYAPNKYTRTKSVRPGQRMAAIPKSIVRMPSISSTHHWLLSKFVIPVAMLLILDLPIMIMNSLCTFGFAQFRLNVVHKHSLTQLQFEFNKKPSEQVC